jgi:hypothetical protein
MTIDLDSSLRTLHAKRTEPLNQVDAIDTALAAPSGHTAAEVTRHGCSEMHKPRDRARRNAAGALYK